MEKCTPLNDIGGKYLVSEVKSGVEVHEKQCHMPRREEGYVLIRVGQA